MEEMVALKILIADDESDIAEIVAIGVRLTWPDCQVSTVTNGEDALKLFAQDNFDLVILDIMMPTPDGFDVCREIRNVSQVPILMLTAKHSTVDKVRALDLGADDYLTKPFDHFELLARLRALVRRSSATGPLAIAATTPEMSTTLADAASPASDASPHTLQESLVVGDLSLDARSRRVTLKGQPVQLTSTEYRLLEELVRNAGHVMPRRTLLERVWGPEYANEEHYLKVFVSRLRTKLGDDADNPHYIQNEWGVGYRLIAS
ncbi:MAG TPA: response regulator transcription factor [Chloroflexia bacterium]|nr:response regulator transcription factor [Chloroflexia bacterium]